MATVGYTSDTELEAYASARGVTMSGDPDVLLTMALDWLELQPFSGEKTDVSQSLQWPRKYVPGVADDEIPANIVTAQIVCAMIYDAGGDPLAVIQPRVTQEKVGEISVSYSDSGPLVTLYPKLSMLLRGLTGGGSSGANQFIVGRG